MCHTHVSRKWFYHMDACAGSVLTPHDIVVNVQNRSRNRSFTGEGVVCVALFWDSQLERGETCAALPKPREGSEA